MILQNMLKLDLILRIMNYIDRYQKEESIEKKILYSFNDSSKDKNRKVRIKSVRKQRLKFEKYEICLEKSHLQNKRNHLEKKLTWIIFKNIMNSQETINQY